MSKDEDLYGVIALTWAENDDYARSLLPHAWKPMMLIGKLNACEKLFKEERVSA